MKILISGIKDEKFYIDTLRKKGHIITSVIMNQDISLLDKYQPEIIILGTCVNSDNGVDIIKDVKNYKQEIKIVVIGNTDALKEELLLEGADVFLVKPVSSEQLMTAVNK